MILQINIFQNILNQFILYLFHQAIDIKWNILIEIIDLEVILELNII